MNDRACRAISQQVKARTARAWCVLLCVITISLLVRTDKVQFPTPATSTNGPAGQADIYRTPCPPQPVYPSLHVTDREEMHTQSSPETVPLMLNVYVTSATFIAFTGVILLWSTDTITTVSRYVLFTVLLCSCLGTAITCYYVGLSKHGSWHEFDTKSVTQVAVCEVTPDPTLTICPSGFPVLTCFTCGDLPVMTQFQTVLIQQSTNSGYLRLLLLQCGDIESNPGPTDHELSGILQRLEAKLDSQSQSFENQLSRIVSEIRSAVVVQGQQLEQKLQANYETLESHILRLQTNVTAVQAVASDNTEKIKNVSDNHDALAARVKELEDEVDRLERYSRRNNVMLYGLPEDEGETYEVSANKAMQTLKRYFPEKDWHRDDIERAHRVGHTQSRRPRPLIIKLQKWADTMLIMRNKEGKELMRQNKMKLSADLTRRQRQTIRELKIHGQQGYFVNGKLRVRAEEENIDHSDHDKTGRNEDIWEQPAGHQFHDPTLSNQVRDWLPDFNHGDNSSPSYTAKDQPVSDKSPVPAPSYASVAASPPIPDLSGGGLSQAGRGTKLDIPGHRKTGASRIKTTSTPENHGGKDGPQSPPVSRDQSPVFIGSMVTQSVRGTYSDGNDNHAGDESNAITSDTTGGGATAAESKTTAGLEAPQCTDVSRGTPADVRNSRASGTPHTNHVNTAIATGSEKHPAAARGQPSKDKRDTSCGQRNAGKVPTNRPATRLHSQSLSLPPPLKDQPLISDRMNPTRRKSTVGSGRPQDRPITASR